MDDGSDLLDVEDEVEGEDGSGGLTIGRGFTTQADLVSNINKIVREKRCKKAEETRNPSKIEQMIEDADMDQETKELLKKWENPRNPEISKMGSRKTMKKLAEIEEKRHQIENGTFEEESPSDEKPDPDEIEYTHEFNTSKSFGKRVQAHNKLKKLAEKTDKVTFERDTKKDNTIIVANNSFKPPINYDTGKTRRSKEYCEFLKKVREAKRKEQSKKNSNSGFEDTDFWLNISQSGKSIMTRYKNGKVFASVSKIRSLLEGEEEIVEFSRPVEKYTGETEWKESGMELERVGKAIVVRDKKANTEYMAPASQVERLIEQEIRGVNLSLPK